MGAYFLERAALRCDDPERWLVQLARYSASRESGCIEWVGQRNQHGYGRFRIKTRDYSIETGAHRAAWLVHRGPIPPGMVVDHLCRNPACVNPEHLEPVTVSENARRGMQADNRRGCGVHQWSDGYNYTRPDGFIVWVCRPCAARRARERYRKKHGGS